MGSTDRDHHVSLPNVDASAVHQPGPERRPERSRQEVAHRFEAAAETANQDLRALQALTDTALSHLALDDLLPVLLQRVTEVLGVDNAAVLLLDSAGQTLTMEAAAKLDVPLSTPVHVPVGQGVAGRIAATRESIVVDDIATFPIAVPLFLEQFHSLAGVPLEIGDQFLGVVLVGTALLRHFTTRDVQLLQQVADRMALAIDRARLYTREHEAREQAEAALAQAQASEHRYRRLVEANIIGIVVGDAERVLEANGAFLRLVGYTQADVQAGRLRQDTLSTPGTHMLSGRDVREALATGASTPFEWEYVRKDGSRVSALVGTALLQRDPVRFVTFVLDLSERKQLDQALAQRVAQLEAVMEAVPGALAVYDTTGRVILANAAFQEHVPAGVTTVAERIQHVGGIFDEQGVPFVEAQWPPLRALHGEVLKGANAVELAVHPPQGEPVYSRLTAAPLRDQAGNIIGAVSLNQDITEQKRLAREREKVRAHELALEDIARHMDEFLAVASHDLRTPLTVVKSRLQIALRRLTRLRDSGVVPPDALPETDLEALHASLLAANLSADKLTRLVAVLFDVARARSGTLELELAPCDLAAIVREQVAAQQMAAPERTIELVTLDDRRRWVQADAARLSQVLGNYLTNALKYSPADQPVTVRLEMVENQAVVSVADHGPGIPLEEQSRVWELFHRVPGIELQYASGESSGSLGLGLHICKQLVELHPGGSAGVESAVGEGSTFWFRLPLVS